MTETTAAALPVPSQEEIDAALRTLTRAWSPNTRLPGDPRPDADADEDEPYETGCDCAGTDEDGEPLGCNCAGGCTCDSCDYYAYSRFKICQARPHIAGVAAQCVKPTRYRVVAFRLDGGWRSTSGLTECPHSPDDKCPCAAGVVFLDHGARPVTHNTLTACSPEHARAIIDGQVLSYAERPDSPTRLRWYFEQWTYEPHEVELPAPLPALRDRVGGARNSVALAVKASVTGGDVEMWLRYTRQDLALAAWHAAQPLARPEDDVDLVDDEPSGPVQEEPDWGDRE